ncbi:A24 family peptidase [Planctomicrobium sp. SH664]|uniref:A24 family peptidase n=1 Tax=Planctomicrobium sp. SH664 TaxID=3448125 RepID=UPI003F5B139A
MFDLSPAILVLVVAVGVFTAVAAFSDIRTCRIPNKLTIPMFFAGWVYQLVMSLLYGWEHLGSAALGFLAGFGLLFILWFVGGGGGGDVKLMGALSVWLGFHLTLRVLLVSTLLVLFGTVGVVFWNVITQGFRKTRSKFLATGKNVTSKAPESREDKLKRRVMAYATPMAIATWIVVLWNVPKLNNSLKAERVTSVPTSTSTVEGT